METLADPFADVLFPMGAIEPTEHALLAIEAAGKTLPDLIQRHAAGIWGDLDKDARWLNEEHLKMGGQLLSAYLLPPGVMVWIVTNTERNLTEVMLREEYGHACRR